MNFGMEMPDCLLKEFSPLCDLEFALAHRVLEDEDYADHFLQAREVGREVILDNGFHELGRPVSSVELLEAAKRVDPSYVICPDFLHDPKKTYEATKEAAKVLGDKYALAVVLVGNDPAERNAFITNCKGFASMLCLPFRAKRLSWFETLDPFSLPGRVHLLGINTIEEIAAFKAHGNYSFFQWSIDSSKPMKWGLMGKKIWTLNSLRGCPLKTPEMLLMTPDQINPLQKMWAAQNIAYLRRVV